MQTAQDNNKHLEHKLKATEEKINQQKDELQEMKEKLEDTKSLEDLLKAKNGVSSVYKGKCDEKYVEIIMKEVASESYTVDNEGQRQKMDVRLH